jgi:hypothetical protein
MFSFVFSASDETFITPVRKECEAKDWEFGCAKKGLDASVGNEVTRPCGRHQSNTDSNRSLMFSVHFSAMPVYQACARPTSKPIVT